MHAWRVTTSTAPETLIHAFPRCMWSVHAAHKARRQLPATCPSIVGVCARLVSKVQAYHFITCYCRREDCPRGAIPDHAGHRSARALAVRPLQAPRVWSWRKDCRQWRRRSATSGSEKSAGRVVGEAPRYTCVYHDGLRVNRLCFFGKGFASVLRRKEGVTQIY